MNLKEIRDLVRDQAVIEREELGDPHLNHWVNDAKNKVEVAQDWPFLWNTDTLSFASGDTTKPLPSDFAHIGDDVRMEKDSDSGTLWPLTRINPEERPYDTDAQGKPSIFWIDFDANGNPQFHIWREPTEAHTLHYRYYQSTGDLSDNADEPTWDQRFHRILVLGALHRVYEWLEMWQEARVIKQDFDEMLARMDFYYNRLRQPVIYGQHGRLPRTVDKYGRGTRHPFAWEV